MKRILSIFVALLMLVSAASAETVLSLADIVVTMNGDALADLTGLELNIATGEVDGAMAIRIDISGNGEALLGADASIVDNKVVFTVDGVSDTYYVDIPVEALGAGNVNLSQFDLSQLDLSNLDIDFDALMGTVMSGIEMNDDTIRVPYTTVNDVLELLAPSLESISIPNVDLSGLADTIAQLKDSDSGITLEGTYAETEDGLTAAITAIPVQGGTEGDAAFNLNFSMAGESIDLNIDVAGQVSLYLKVAAAGEDKFSVSLGGSVEGTDLDISALVGSSEADVNFSAIDAEGAIDIQSLSEEASEDLFSAATGLLMFVYGGLNLAA